MNGPCKPVGDVDTLVPGWICCGGEAVSGCSTYNGAVDANGVLRTRCRHCGHLRCCELSPELVARARSMAPRGTS